MNSSRLELLEDLARKAGAIALEKRDNLDVSQKADGTFVTNADFAVQEFLFGEISKALPGYSLIGEENCCQTLGGNEDGPFLIIDPIDGTDVYRAGLAYFCISIGLYEKGRFSLGVVYLPVLKDMYSVDEGQPPMKNGVPISVCNECEITENSFLAAPSYFHRKFHSEFPGKIRSLGSTAFHLVLAASGGCIGAIPMAHIWDIAGGLAILEAAGGRFAQFNGQPLDYQTYLDGRRLPKDLLGAPDRLFDKITATIRLR